MPMKASIQPPRLRPFQRFPIYVEHLSLSLSLSLSLPPSSSILIPTMERMVICGIISAVVGKKDRITFSILNSGP
jgi:hypothetical protein